MGTEIEKKYLLESFPEAILQNKELKLISTQHIYQTYLAFSDKEEIRVRQLVDHDGTSTFTHTFKSGHGMVRQEIEYPISEEIYRQLLGNTQLVPLEKVRTTVEHQGHRYEIDEYKQIDLLVVEVEFADESAAYSFQPPEWFGRELGQEEEFRNKTLWIGLQTQNDRI
ncbi:CYTH domain-containing protein [Paenibacillus sp. OAS669]|uniref:CYTH domain-containing protein n=1 Tax=Paenibacillus sp. OAS669 TaxID=2663821 RepID=UPI00178949C2|nr:CYTH domain-containing protein [Paenibacillus sp. OAS669]MBE1444956.1 CYTH domain-containing protein [Paenibacillus sp. OAS669]